jgi:hypothetical protein
MMTDARGALPVLTVVPFSTDPPLAQPSDSQFKREPQTEIAGA